MRSTTPLLALALILPAPALAREKPAPDVPASIAAPAPTAADADAFVAAAERELAAFNPVAQKSEWVNETYITDDTELLNARVQAELTAIQVRLAKGATTFDAAAGLSPDTIRKLGILKQGITLPAPETPGAGGKLAAIAAEMQGMYGKGKGTLAGRPISGSDIEAKMGTDRNPAELKEMWTSWHDDVGKPMKPDYVQLVTLANAGARNLGYADLGAMWRSGYDMPPAEFAKLIDRLWTQVKPLYAQLHCYVRAKLADRYGPDVQKPSGPIRADLLGNMWAQEWGNIYDIAAPAGAGDIGYDTGALLRAHGYDPLKMVRTAEGFYTSLGFPGLPATFYERSQFVKPQDRDVVCHASAWDVDDVQDLRVKVCLKVNSDDFVTIHHELGHNFYQRAYDGQPFLYRNGANDGFHEAIGDFIALSVTPDYLVKLGLLPAAKVPGPDKDIGLLLRQAMDKVAFLPFALVIDKWRWGVFDGSISPANYSSAWDDLRLQYQGVAPPAERPDDAFDPGGKYHVAASTPYARYFLARLLQFQFHAAACRQAGWTGPLHRCSFYGNAAVGAKLNAMLAMGASRPWPDALETFTGTREIDGQAMLDYFAPLMAWLEDQNKGRQCGW